MNGKIKFSCEDIVISVSIYLTKSRAVGLSAMKQDHAIKTLLNNSICFPKEYQIENGETRKINPGNVQHPVDIPCY